MEPPEDLTQLCGKCNRIKECQYKLVLLTITTGRKTYKHVYPQIYVCKDCVSPKLKDFDFADSG